MIASGRQYFLECSRAPQGVATATVPVCPDVPDELALIAALRELATAAARHHGEDMVPSTDPADYTVREVAADEGVRVYLRPDHPWWGGPIAARVARRNHVDPEAWRRMNEAAAVRGWPSTAARVPPPLERDAFE